MLRQFAAGSIVGCIITAIASAGVLILSGLNPRQYSLVLAAWCIVPSVWGLWAMLSPPSWLPQRLPIWGTILGILAALMALFVVDIPYRVFGVTLPTTAAAIGVLAGALVYYLLWTIVRIAYMRLMGSSSAPSAG